MLQALVTYPRHPWLAMIFGRCTITEDVHFGKVRHFTTFDTPRIIPTFAVGTLDEFGAAVLVAGYRAAYAAVTDAPYALIIFDASIADT